ncbi:MAG TPA: DNA polymerase III subunit delta' [Pirellulales bacterium]|nr:DNA polymerase III subunit delta' [Pirellulales bacterium]
MSWHHIEGHDTMVERFRNALARGRLASTFLFVGPAGIGKRTFAMKLAQALLCEQREAAQLDPCERCPACVQVAAGTHPDLETVSKPADKSFIPLAAFIGDPEHRMQEGLCHRIGLKPFMGGRKIAIIDDADYLNQEGANALLKTLEEPPPRSVLILIGTSVDKQLPTIRSRAQIIRFQPLAEEIVAKLLVEREIAADPAEARRLASYSGGSLEQAVELADAALWSFRGDLLGSLARWPVEGYRTAQSVNDFINEAGKDAAPRRARSRLLIGFGLDFFRALVRRLHGHAAVEHAELAELVEQAIRNGWNESAAVAALERSLDALSHVDRNANQATMVESWFDDLAALSAPLSRV